MHGIKCKILLGMDVELKENVLKNRVLKNK